MIKVFRRRKKLRAHISILFPLIIIAVMIMLIIVSGVFLFREDSSLYPSILSYQTVFSQLITDKVDKKLEFSTLTEATLTKRGTYAIYIKDITRNDVFAFNETKNMYGASLYKTPVSVAALKQIESKKLAYTTELIYLPSDFSDGTGVINHNSYGTKLTIEQIVNELIKNSDNTGQVMLTRVIPKADLQTAFESNLNTPGSKFFSDNITNAKEVAEYFEKVYTGNYLTTNSKEFFINLHSKTSFDDRITQHLTNNLSFAHKIGNWGDTGSWHDCGLIYNKRQLLSVCVMSELTTFEDFLDITKKTAEFINKITN